MPVRRFRSIEDMPATPEHLEPGSDALWRAIQTAWAWAAFFSPPEIQPGVYKHRTVEAWNNQTDAWERAAIGRATARMEQAASAEPPAS